jgi:hypothetical protein
MLVYVALWFSLVVPVLQREAASPPLDGTRPIVDNEQVRVWDLTWSRGLPAAMDQQRYESLWISVSPEPGAVVHWEKGVTRQVGSTGSPARMIVIDVKDHRVPPLVNRSGFPNAFERPGIQKAFENDRVVVWDYTWTLGQPTPMHFHDTDVVVVFLKAGSLQSTTPDGRSVVNKVTTGTTRFNLRDRVHTELLVEGESRAIITELK